MAKLILGEGKEDIRLIFPPLGSLFQTRPSDERHEKGFPVEGLHAWRLRYRQGCNIVLGQRKCYPSSQYTSSLRSLHNPSPGEARRWCLNQRHRSWRQPPSSSIRNLFMTFPSPSPLPKGGEGNQGNFC